MKLTGVAGSTKDTKNLNVVCSNCSASERGFLCCHSPEVTDFISKIKVNCSFKAGEFLFHAGASSLGLYVIKSGIVKIELLTDDGDAHTVRLVGAGGLVGYRSFFSDQNYKKSAIAIEDCEVCFLPRAEVIQIFQAEPVLTLKLAKQFSEDLDYAEKKWVDQIDKGAPARIANALLFLNDKFADSSWTRKEIAEWAGTTPETVIRTLAQFEKDQLITQNYRNFSILDRQGLMERSKL